LKIPGGELVIGKVRAAAPTVDAASRTAIVYVDLPLGSPARAGMFARGDFELGAGSALTLPQSAVLLRDGFHYVLRVAPDNTVALVKVTVGQRNGERIEIVDGIEPSARFVATGAAFLADGDTVRIVDAKPDVNAVSNPGGQAAAPLADPKAQR
ncbi:MAG: efflux transporter periplasmic adaptor subunit, partial [Burkholderiaceae bacterium]|nr:efflux transporter periplasmic adaptor subunit [Burkholderiaceae bacterium]